MYKKILNGIAVVFIITVIVLNINFSAKYSDSSDLFLANIEALARNESFTCSFGCSDIGSGTSIFMRCDCILHWGGVCNRTGC